MQCIKQYQTEGKLCLAKDLKLFVEPDHYGVGVANKNEYPPNSHHPLMNEEALCWGSARDLSADLQGR